MNICFIMDPWHKIIVENDSTLRLIHVAVKRGHTVGIMAPNHLGIRNSTTHGNLQMIVKNNSYQDNPVQFHKKVIFKQELLPLAGFDVIFLRADPPIDPIMLNFLDSVKQDVLIINDIDGLRKANNKLYTASFYETAPDIIPVTHVSKNKDYLKQIIRDSPSGRMILKPLNGFGGRGVIVIETNAMHNVNSLLDFYIHGKDESNYVIVQEFVEGAEEGDTRVLMLNGEPIGALDRIPAKDDIRSNIHAGGSIRKHVLTDSDLEICRKIGPKLVKDGLFLAGIDIIKGKVIEINVISPGGIPMINKLNKETSIQMKIIDFTEDIVSEKHSAIQRKLKDRDEVTNIHRLKTKNI